MPNCSQLGRKSLELRPGRERERLQEAGRMAPAGRACAERSAASANRQPGVSSAPFRSTFPERTSVAVGLRSAVLEIRKTEESAEWLDGLRDLRGRARVQARIERLAGRIED